MRKLRQLPNRVVFMDAGLTLFEEETLYGGRAPKEGFIQVPALSWQDEDTAVRARPSARPALEQLRARGEFVVVLTGGDLESAEAWLKAIGLDQLVEDVIGSADLRRLGRPRFSVLFDDEEEPQSKVEAMVGHRKPTDEYQKALATCFVHCDAYVFGDDSHPLTDKVDEGVRLLDAQEAAG